MKSHVEIQNKNVEKIEKIDKLKVLEAQRKNKSYKDTEKPNYDRFKEQTDFNLRHDNIKDRVKSILMFDKFARKNDLWLYLLYLNKMGWITLKVDINEFNKVNPPEAVSRSRRQLFSEIRDGKHEKLKYLIDTETEEIRKNEESLYHDYHQDKNISKQAKVIK